MFQSIIDCCATIPRGVGRWASTYRQNIPGVHAIDTRTAGVLFILGAMAGFVGFICSATQIPPCHQNKDSGAADCNARDGYIALTIGCAVLGMVSGFVSFQNAYRRFLLLNNQGIELVGPKCFDYSGGQILRIQNALVAARALTAGVDGAGVGHDDRDLRTTATA